MLGRSTPAEEALAPAPTIRTLIYDGGDGDGFDDDDDAGDGEEHLRPSKLSKSNTILVWLATSTKQKVQNAHLTR